MALSHLSNDLDKVIRIGLRTTQLLGAESHTEIYYTQIYTEI